MPVYAFVLVQGI